MRQILLMIIGVFTFCKLSAQTDYIHTDGKYILGPCGDTLHLKGINYAPYNWGNEINDQRIAEIAQTGANAVRMPWYWSNPGANVYYDYVALDSIISKCVQNKLIVILELHDFTCENDPNELISGAAWWTNNSVIPILNRYKESIIVNIANEALYVNWTGNPTAALATYTSTYQTIISNLRNVTGFNYPILIDAPDCGQNSDVFITSSTAANLISTDPKHNLIFSAHAYWYAYANNDSTQMANKVNAVLADHIPFVLGEVANQQDDQTMCQYTLNYKPLLRYCEANKINWLAWSWDRDICSQRQMSTNGTFASLTTYGNDLINNPDYGLSTRPAAKSEFLVNGGCSTALVNETVLSRIHVYPNPNNGTFSLKADQQEFEVSCYDLLGNKVMLNNLGNSNYQIPSLPGVYLLKLQSAEGEAVSRFIVR
ncbi:cellulase family glycosylhydrolase [Fluviicola sp.]|uniref:cellulase family glycosylhydrolase n=1 Tax=Fluviicola sp. TaxID=1917219 RepID=UPI002628A1FD|nr:cellulase family glycosylhydrolase [Fluviicola sp.]